MQAQAQTFDVGGLRVRWYEQGAGLPVILLHGIPTSPLLWRHVLRHLHGVRVLAWEMIGYGESIPEGIDRDISVAAQADHLVRWIDALGLEPAVLVGHDLGGGVAQIAALRRPNLCAGLVLANSIGYDSWPIAPVRAMVAAAGVVQRLPNWLFKPMLHALVGLGHDNSEIANESFELHWASYDRHGGAAAIVRQARALDVRDTLEIADEVPRLARVPTRVVWGAADRFQRVRYGERLARDLNVELERIEGGRHFTPEDHPEAIARAIYEVVGAVQARAGAARAREEELQPRR